MSPTTRTAHEIAEQIEALDRYPESTDGCVEIGCCDDCGGVRWWSLDEDGRQSLPCAGCQLARMDALYDELEAAEAREAGDAADAADFAADVRSGR